MKWIIGLVFLLILVIFLYAILPNIFTRVFRWHVFVKGPRQKQQVALTFDDGPNPDYTPTLLDALKSAGISATFFVLGQCAMENPEILRRMIEEGHDVQIHGWKHQLVPLMLPRQTIRQFAATQKTLQAQFGIHPTLYRPTWGLCNFVTLVSLQARFRLITWSVMVGDWRITKAEELNRRIQRKLHRGAVIVLHDSDKSPGAQPGAPNQVIRLIPQLAESVRHRGYEFCLLKEWV